MNYRTTGLLTYCRRLHRSSLLVQLHVFRIMFSASVGEQHDGKEYERALGAACRPLRDICIYLQQVEPVAVAVSQVAAYVLLLVPMMLLAARKLSSLCSLLLLTVRGNALPQPPLLPRATVMSQRHHKAVRLFTAAVRLRSDGFRCRSFAAPAGVGLCSVSRGRTSPPTPLIRRDSSHGTTLRWSK